MQDLKNVESEPTDLRSFTIIGLPNEHKRKQCGHNRPAGQHLPLLLFKEKK